MYLAKIVLAAWRGQVAQEQIPAGTLAQAFYPAVRDHLIAAYGWFLLLISQSEWPLPALPRSCEQLPPLPEGKVFPGEINEFRQLEANGWLRDMLAPTVLDMPTVQQSGNLATVGADIHDMQQAALWLAQLNSLFDRMGDSLDEY